MTEEQTTKVQYEGKTLELPPEAVAFVKSLTDNGVSQDVAMAALKAASGAFKASAKPKEVVPDLADMAQGAVDSACKRSKALQAELDALTQAKSVLDEITEEAVGLTGFRPVKQYASFFKFTFPVESEGVRELLLHGENDSELAEAGQAVIDAKRKATSAVMEVVNKVAEKKGIDPVPSISMQIDGRTVVLSQKKAGTRRSGGGGGTRASYDAETGLYGTITIKMSQGEEITDEVIAVGKTEDELVKALKENLPKRGKTFYLSQWNRQDWWPKADES